MLDATPPTATDLADIVVIGAGVSGLNVLNSCRAYLPTGAKAVVIDGNPQAGGMWNIAYDYVRLHQPHSMFTVGAMRWDWDKPRDYLARRDEVRDHLARAIGPIENKFRFTSHFGHTVTRCEEIETPDGPLAEITFHPNGEPEKLRTIRATNAVHSAGVDYRCADPLPVSSDRVLSIIPQELGKTLAAHPGAPVFVVGGGKTGMDTILAAAEDADRAVHLVNGSGTNFISRDVVLPKGVRRWYAGHPVSMMFRDLAATFDGDNEDALIDHVRARYSTAPDVPNGTFLYGLQSMSERHRVDTVTDIIDGYFADVEDTSQGPALRLRDGRSLSVPEGAVFVNCTGSFFRSDRMTPMHPLISSKGAVLSVNIRNAFHFLSSVAGFFTPHLFYRGLLRDHGFYALDHEVLFRRNRNAWVGASAAQAYLNQVRCLQLLPVSVLDRCGLDMDRWYPIPRRLLAMHRMKSGADKDLAHCTAVLDRVAERFDVLCKEIV